MNRRTALLRLGALSSFAVVGPSWRGGAARKGADRGETWGERLQGLDIERVMRLAAVPSMAMATIEGANITTRALGVRRTGEATPASADTVYAAASLTKAVVAYTLLSLADEGVLSLDRPVGEYLPLPNADDARAKGITARHLLSHSGGWRNWRNNMQQPLTADFEPGARWSYSGEGFFFLQRVLEKLTNRALGELVRERVFSPLGMSRSALVLTPEQEPHLAPGHNSRGEPTQAFGRPALLELRRVMQQRNASLDQVRVEDAEQALRTAEPPLPVLPNFLSPNAAASLTTTADDFARFVRHLVTARAEGGRAARVAELLLSPQVRCNEVLHWGLGVGLEDTTSGRSAWQWGDNPGYKNFFFATPASGKGLVIFTNGDRGARVYERVIRSVTGEDRAAFLFA